MIRPIAQGIPRLTPVETTKQDTPIVNNGHCGLASDKSLRIEAASADVLAGGLGGSETTAGGAVSGSAGLGCRDDDGVVDFSFCSRAGFGVCVELCRIRNVVSNGDGRGGCIQRVGGSRTMIPEDANDRAKPAFEAALTGTARQADIAGEQAAQLRAIPRPCRAAMMAECSPRSLLETEKRAISSCPESPCRDVQYTDDDRRLSDRRRTALGCFWINGKRID